MSSTPETFRSSLPGIYKPQRWPQPQTVALARQWKVLILMGIIIAAMFGGIHELELLLAKLHVETNFTKRWVIVENSYSLKGIRKERVLAEIVSSDSRFDQFGDRLSIVELDENLVPEVSSRDYARWLLGRMAHGGRDFKRARTTLKERPFFRAEELQRDAVLPEIALHALADDWIIPTDVDEMVDLSDPARLADFNRCEGLNFSLILLRGTRFQYDFDNLTNADKLIPALKWRELSSGKISGIDAPRKWSNGRRFPVPSVTSAERIVVEYTYCFPLSAVRRKLETFAHVATADSILDQSLLLNHALREPAISVFNPADWFERYPANGTLHPEYVVRNFDRLRTGTVNPQYGAARATLFPARFTDQGELRSTEG